MKKYFNDHKKLIIMSVLMIAFVAACQSARDQQGNLKEGMLITLNTGYGECISQGWFNIFVWPVAQLINIVAGGTDAGFGIIVVTILLNALIAVFTIKQQVATQKMQLVQPELEKLQAKYAGKTDQNSKMRQAQEMQALYSKHNINPFGQIITLFVQFPVIFAVYQAVIRAEAVDTGSFLGIKLSQTPIDGFKALNIGVIIIYILMILFQFLAFKLPQYMQKREKEKAHVKTKDYAKPEKKGKMQNSMNMMMYMSLGMVVLFSINWPLGMSFYWMVSAFTRVIQSIIIQKKFIKNEF